MSRYGSAAISPEDIAEAFRNEPETGKFFWRERAQSTFGSVAAFKMFERRYAGREAFTSISTQGYRTVRLHGRVILAHRAAFAIMTGRWPAEQVDHINGARTDNRWLNLREADQPTNSRNTCLRLDNSSGRIGVHFDAGRGKWIAQGRASGVHYNLGRFDRREHAESARHRFEVEHNFHPNHGRQRAL